MAYRDTRDPRIALLAAQIAEAPELRAQLARTRREHDSLQVEADRLGIVVATPARERRGGMLARAASWFGGRPSAADIERSERELAAATARLAELAAVERELSRKLADIAGARTELAALVAQGLTTLRASEGPLGDELRALDAEAAAAGERIAAFDAVLVACDRAHVVLADFSNDEAARRAADSPIRRVGLVAAAITLPALVDDHVRERIAIAERTRLYLPHSHELLAAAVPMLAQLRRRYALWIGDPELERACARLAASVHGPADAAPDESPLAREPGVVLAALEQVASALATERGALVRRRDALLAQQRRMVEAPP